MRHRTGVAGALIAAAAVVTLAQPAHAQDVDCSSFTYQEDAQSVFRGTPGDPYRLDEDNDGVACEWLPHRGLTSSTTRPTAPATLAPTRPPTIVPTRPATLAPTRGVQGGLGGASNTGPTAWDIAIGTTFVAGAALAGGYVVRRRRAQRR
ncbi:excalibur calcium-binding domain-containing protein [Streptomyces griseosporeus]|uniref:excalibur calcium-binding domain-containing protein n=1 Tax=Streptomyces griseosporeus TaxID=1910 RepID=UPI0036FD0020